MILKEYLPKFSLNEFVRCYRIVHFEFGQTDNIPVKAYPPKPESILHFFLRDFWAVQQPSYQKLELPPIVLVGQRTSLVHQFTGRSFLNVQVVFQPTAIFRLTGIPAYELTNRHIDASLFFKSDIKTVLEQLQQAKNYTEMLNIVEHFCFGLVNQLRKDIFPIDAVSKNMIKQVGNVSLDDLAKNAYLCTKQFKRNFYESVGVNPKIYSRIIRFNMAYNLKNAYPERDWLSVSIECGYYDYQHMVRDYKDFTGKTPNEFLALESHAPERILGLANLLYRERVNLLP